MAASILAVLSGCDELLNPPEPEPEVTTAPKKQGVKANEGVLSMPDATLAEICADDGLLLARHEVSILKHRFTEVCCGPDGLDPSSERCAAPWPGPDDMPCERWSELHAHLLARYGHRFQNEKLQSYFDEQPWYQPNKNFRTGMMSITAKRNVSALELFLRERKDCVATGDAEP
ncbi:MAG: YARHG domain-containing protein [Deltaproteobacteria bacterium]|nr:MAG: YARHG domain-containing protein [Deltaproteobacteria bacterium]